MPLLMRLILCLEVVEDIAYAQAVAANLVGVCGSDALTGSSHLVFSFGSFVSGVEQTVGRHYEVCLA